MHNDPFEREVAGLFGQAPAFDDGEVFAAAVMQRLENYERLRRRVLAGVGAGAAGVCVLIVLRSGLSSDLAQLAGLTPASVICEILKDDGEMARLPDLIVYAKQHGLKIGTIADLIEHRSQHEKLVERVARRKVQTAYGEFDLVTYVDKTTQRTHLALVHGDLRHNTETLVRVHEPLSVMDFLEQADHSHSISVNKAMQKIGQSAAGVLVLLHRGETPQELRARAALDVANQQTTQWDPRSYGIGAQILRDLNVGKMRLLATPHKMPSMTGFGLEVVGYASHET